MLIRVIEVLKLIGEAGMSYRGKRFENAASLSKANVYRGNFLEILRPIAMFDVVFKEHLNEVESKVKQESGGRGRSTQRTSQ